LNRSATGPGSEKEGQDHRFTPEIAELHGIGQDSISRGSDHFDFGCHLADFQELAGFLTSGQARTSQTDGQENQE
jgi:hypothetical protein